MSRDVDYSPIVVVVVVVVVQTSRCRLVPSSNSSLSSLFFLLVMSCLHFFFVLNAKIGCLSRARMSMFNFTLFDFYDTGRCP